MDQTNTKYCITKLNDVTSSFIWYISNGMLLQRFEEPIESSKFSVLDSKEKKHSLELTTRLNGAHVYFVSGFNSNVYGKIKFNVSLSILGSENEKLKEESFATTWEKISLKSIVWEKTDFLCNDGLTIQFTISTILGRQAQECDRQPLSKISIEIPPYENKLFKNQNLADFTFILGKQELKAHKCMLAAHSSVFDALFQSDNWKENLQNKMEISDVSFKVFQEMLRYIYTGEVLNLHKIAEELMYLAEKYAIQELKNLCIIKLSKQINKKNAWKMLKMAENFQSEYLKNETMQFILLNRAFMVRQSEFEIILREKPSLIKYFLKFDNKVL